MAKARKAEIDLATAPLEDVKKHLKKLKSREAELELALTLRNDPTVEEQLVRMTTCVADLKATEKQIALATKPDDEEENEAQRTVINKRIEMLQAKIDTVPPGPRAEKLSALYADGLKQAKLALENVGLSTMLIKLREHFERVQIQLVATFADWEAQGIPEQFDPFEHIPGLDQYLEKSEA